VTVLGALASTSLACPNPGGPYSDLAVATIGDPMADGGSAGAVTMMHSGCAEPTDGLYAAAFVQQRERDGGPFVGTCGAATGSYVNGSSLAAPPYCPHGSGSVSATSARADGGARECAVTISLRGCAVSSDTTIDSFEETGSWSADQSTFTGTLELTATTSGTTCSGGYEVTFTRQ